MRSAPKGADARDEDPTRRATNEVGLMNWEMRPGAWEDVLADVQEVDAVIVDPPYSERTHAGHDDAANLANREGRGWMRSDGATDAFRARRAISYSHWTAEDVEAFVASWAPRCNGWFVAMSDSDLCDVWRAAYERHGLTGFQPVPLVIPGMTVRLSGDGPSSWAVYLNVGRPKALVKWGTLDGAYIGKQGEREHIGGKPLATMRQIVRDYTKPGDLVCDPCAGMGTTLLAAAMEGRHAIGAEVDPKTAAAAMARIRRDYTIDMFSATLGRRTCPKCRVTYRPDAFAVDRNSPTGRQSWCRRCKVEWEHGLDGSWKRLKAWLAKEEPNSLDASEGGTNLKGWTPEKFTKKWKEHDGHCSLCGAGLREWQSSGHNLDRIDNNTPHIPGNCRLVCWPCNKKKGNGHPAVAYEEIAALVKKYGHGLVPWQLILIGMKRIELPDLAEYRVDREPEQRGLF